MRAEVTHTTGARVPGRVVRAVCRRAQAHFGFPVRTEITCAFVTDEAIRTLNRQARGQRRATDVLAFPLHPPRAWRRAGRDPDGRLRLGDVVISIPTARRQAQARGVPVEREVGALFTHGLLHCLGYDHTTKRDAAAMSRLAGKLWPE